jgi:hypothetical protein
MPSCKSCNAPIRWVLLRSKDGELKPHPLDAKPSADSGNIGIVDTAGREPIAEIVPKAQLALFGGANAAPRYTSHFATCANAAQHRRAK